MDRILKALKKYQIEPPAKLAAGTNKKGLYRGECFRRSGRYFIDHYNEMDMKIVHGTYNPDNLPINFKHGWVEIGDDIVFDGVFQRFYDKQGYYQTLNAVKHVEYDYQEFDKLLYRKGTWDAWHLSDEECRKKWRAANRKLYNTCFYRGLQLFI